MTEVKMYKANDGTLFEDRWKCDMYERETPLAKELESADIKYLLASETIAPILTSWDYISEDEFTIWLMPTTEKSLVYLSLKTRYPIEWEIGKWYCAQTSSPNLDDEIYCVRSLNEMLDGVDKVLEKLGVTPNDPHA